GQRDEPHEVLVHVVDHPLVEMAPQRGLLEVVSRCPREPRVVRPVDERARPRDLADRPPAHDVAGRLGPEVERVPVQMLEALPARMGYSVAAFARTAGPRCPRALSCTGMS